MPLYINPIVNGTTLQTNANFNISSATTTDATATIRAITSQTSRLLTFQNDAGNTIADFDTSGNIRAASLINPSSANNARVVTSTTGTLIDVGTTNNVVLRVRGGTAPQTANLQEWQNSAGSILANVDSAGFLSLGALAPTHTLTLPSTATGITLYNTADQTTNFERVRHFWSGGTYLIAAQQGGTGANRAIRISTVNNAFGFQVNNASPNGMASIAGSTGIASAICFLVNPSYTSSSGTQFGLSITPAISQTSTAGYTALIINPTETTTGSGAKNLIDAQVGGVSRFTVSNTGTITIADGANIDVGSTNGTKIGLATTEKLGFWNATPIVQPTTAVAEAVYVENSGGVNVNDDSTFDGYTLRQVVKALRNAGLLA